LRSLFCFRENLCFLSIRNRAHHHPRFLSETFFTVPPPQAQSAERHSPFPCFPLDKPFYRKSFSTISGKPPRRHKVRFPLFFSTSKNKTALPCSSSPQKRGDVFGDPFCVFLQIAGRSLYAPFFVRDPRFCLTPQSLPLSRGRWVLRSKTRMRWIILKREAFYPSCTLLRAIHDGLPSIHATKSQFMERHTKYGSRIHQKSGFRFFGNHFFQYLLLILRLLHILITYLDSSNLTADCFR